MSWYVGVDIGGTFTDFMFWNEVTGQTYTKKLLTTPQAPHRAVVEGLKQAFRSGGVSPKELQIISHATTLATNAVIERRGARVGFITTEGFRDVLIVGREHRYDMQDLLIELPKALVRRSDIIGVPERVNINGEILRELDLGAVRQAAEDLRARGCEAIAVGFLHSYREPVHERQAAELLRRELGLPYVAVSHEIAPLIREYERFSTTVVNAFLQPLIDEYLAVLQAEVAELGVEAPIVIMLSNGGLSMPQDARAYPVRLVESGPAAGVMAATGLVRALGVEAALSFDMGGTTAKGSMILDGTASTSAELEVARLDRFKAGSGLPLSVPTVDLIEIGAGGGSITSIDNLGRLLVGPRSAGAEPGPACYGLGGTEPTVTDADLLLGYLNPEMFAGGEFNLNLGAAETAIREHVAKPLGVSTVQAAWGIHTAVNQNMASAFRVHSIERGVDIRKYPVVAFGGAGPVHANALAEALGTDTVVVPFTSSVFSAVGLVETPPSFEAMLTRPVPLTEADWDEIDRVYRSMEQDCGAKVDRANVRRSELVTRRSVEMRYVGQQRQIPLDLPDLGNRSAVAAQLSDAFAQAYRARYAQEIADVAVEIVNLRVTVSAAAYPRVPTEPDSPVASVEEAQYNARQVWFDDSAAVRTPAYLWKRMTSGMEVAGPACVDDENTTVVVRPGWRVRVEKDLTLIITRENVGKGGSEA